MKQFISLTDWLTAVRKAQIDGIIDERLKELDWKDISYDSFIENVNKIMESMSISIIANTNFEMTLTQTWMLLYYIRCIETALHNKNVDNSLEEIADA